MHIAVFTANQPRHIGFLEQLAKTVDKVTAVIEGNTAFPGQNKDLFDASPVMQEYFSHVRRVEDQLFGKPRFLPENVRTLVLKFGDLDYLDDEILAPVFEADMIILAGASYIKGPLCDRLIKSNAINIHMGVSPEYRGRHCNFWAVYDGHPELVGGTVHRVNKGLDTGDVLFHSFPKPQKVDPFLLGMKAFEVIHMGVVERIKDGSLWEMEPQKQNPNRRLRYSINTDFDDSVAAPYLRNLPTSDEIYQALLKRDNGEFVRPYLR